MSSDDIDGDLRRYRISHIMKNEGNATVLAVILGVFGILGIGHMYIGKIGKGVGYLVLGFILLIVGIATLFIFVGIIFLLGYFIVFIIHIIGLRNDCKDFNEYFLHTKKQLW